MTYNHTGDTLYLAPKQKNTQTVKEFIKDENNAPKNLFCITYDPVVKEALLSAIHNLGCAVVALYNLENCITISATKTQLAGIKALNGIENVKIADESQNVITSGVSPLQAPEKSDTIN